MKKILYLFFYLFVMAGIYAGPVEKAKLIEQYGKMPLYFISNQDVYPNEVLFYAKTPRATVFFTKDSVVFTSIQGKHGETQTSHSYRIEFAGSQATQISGLDVQEHKVNYFRGNDPKKWQTKIPTFAKLCYRNIYPGIDLVYFGKEGMLKYEYLVQPGADISKIKLIYHNVQSLGLNAEGDLLIQTKLGTVTDMHPVSYQRIEGKEIPVTVRFVTTENTTCQLKAEQYNPAYPLVVDPYLLYSTFLGGSGGDYGRGLTLDSSGNAYITGATDSNNFPTSTGAYDTTYNSGQDVFITKLNTTGSALTYSTYLGGTGNDSSSGIAIDGSGNAYVTGSTESNNFPTTTGTYDTTFNGNADVFVTALNTDSSYDYGLSIAVNTSGNAYVTGYTSSSSFPTTTGAYDTTANGSADGFVTKFKADGSGLLYSTYLGGSDYEVIYGIAVSSSGYAYVTGRTESTDFPVTSGAADTSHNGSLDGFVTKLKLDGSDLVFSTFLGGSNNDYLISIAIDSNGNPYITGYSNSNNFPVTPGAYDTSYNGSYDGFVTKLSSDGSGLIYSTYLGGSGEDVMYSISLDSGNNAYITGYTYSIDFPTTTGAYDSTQNGGYDSFIAKLNGSGSEIVYSTYLGGTGNDYGYCIVLDTSNNVYVTGYTTGSDFPTTSGAYDTTYNGGGNDGFISKFYMKRGVARDTNRDAKSDICWRDTATNNKVWFMNAATVTQENTLECTATNWDVVGSGDFDGDNQCYILWRIKDGSNVIWLMDGSTHTAGTIPWMNTKYNVAAVADLDGDGCCDIVWRYHESTTVHDTYEIWFMQGVKVMKVVKDALPVGNSWTLAGAGDFNGDGKSDLFWRVADASNTVYTSMVWLMDGENVLESAVVTKMDKNWTLAGTGDFNGDSNSDILWRNTSTGANSIWIMNGLAITQNAAIDTLATSWKLAQIGDFDGDGKSDILWRTTSVSTKNNVIWFMNGITITQKSNTNDMPTSWTVTGGQATSEGREAQAGE